MAARSRSRRRQLRARLLRTRLQWSKQSRMAVARISSPARTSRQSRMPFLLVMRVQPRAVAVDAQAIREARLLPAHGPEADPVFDDSGDVLYFRWRRRESERQRRGAG